MNQLESLLRAGVPWERVDAIMRASKPTQNLLRLGLPTSVIKRVLDDSEQCAFNGSK